MKTLSNKNLSQDKNFKAPDRPWIWISIDEQRLRLVQGQNILLDSLCSTAKRGMGCQKHSFKSPDGWHEIAEKIGNGKAIGQVFESRQAVNAIWDHSQKTEKDLILTRILWLRGLTKGHNLGGMVDSYERYIYIHGTNHEDLLGSPQSAGCFRLKNEAVVQLYDEIEESTKVYISKY